mmetsp:Transcript_10404/g.15431  ORF Transcript_10404/g.15431 Transcript_10404/m.15431 type:complete len:87 (-) Transcript_10404:773-1033(-)
MLVFRCKDMLLEEEEVSASEGAFHVIDCNKDKAAATIKPEAKEVVHSKVNTSEAMEGKSSSRFLVLSTESPASASHRMALRKEDLR